MCHHRLSAGGRRDGYATLHNRHRRRTPHDDRAASRPRRVDPRTADPRRRPRGPVPAVGGVGPPDHGPRSGGVTPLVRPVGTRLDHLAQAVDHVPDVGEPVYGGDGRSRTASDGRKSTTTPRSRSARPIRGVPADANATVTAADGGAASFGAGTPRPERHERPLLPDRRPGRPSAGRRRSRRPARGPMGPLEGGAVVRSHRPAGGPIGGGAWPEPVTIRTCFA